MPSCEAPWALGLLLLVPACSTPPGLPPGFGALALEAAEDEPLRLQVVDDRIIAAAVPLGPGGLPGPVRVAADAIAPGGRQVFAGREWSWRGTGFRVEKEYADGAGRHFRSVLLDEAGAVLERSHSVPPADVPQAVLLAAVAPGRTDVTRAEIVSGPNREEGWRLHVVDRGGRTFVVECDLAGGTARVARLLRTSTQVR